MPLEVIEDKIFSHDGRCSPNFLHKDYDVSCSLFQFSADQWWKIILNLNIKDRTYETWEYNVSPDEEKTLIAVPKPKYYPRTYMPIQMKMKFDTAKLYLFSGLTRFEVNID